ncbi:MAG: DUF6134 family protein [Alphaproteobacteria bacterium]|jgi:hypothetical protein
MRIRLGSSKTFLALMACLLSLSSFSPVRAAVPHDGNLDFTVLRDGDEIGSHRLHFSNGEEGLRVDIKTNIQVKMMFITAYRFEHDGHEIWRDGRLTRLWSKTNDDGKKHDLNVAAAGGKLVVEGDGKRDDAPAEIVPASLWNENILKGGTILNTLDGRGMKVAVKNMGADVIEARGHRIQATHYAITGDLERELWFDSNAVLVKVRFKGNDGSEIQYVLR